MCVNVGCPVKVHPPWCKIPKCDGKACYRRHRPEELKTGCQNKRRCCMVYLSRPEWLPAGTKHNPLASVLCSKNQVSTQCKAVNRACHTHNLRLKDAAVALKQSQNIFAQNIEEMKQSNKITAQLRAAHDELQRQRRQFGNFFAKHIGSAKTLDKHLKNRLYREMFRLSPFNRDSKGQRLETKPLPALAFRDEVVAALQRSQVIIVQGQTGSGKSTQLPQYLAEEKVFGKVCVTQPRKVSAIELAKRVAYEFSAGSRTVFSNGPKNKRTVVGSSDVLFNGGSERMVGNRITFMTESTMLHFLLGKNDEDSKSSKNELRWNTIVLDEAHERSIQCDILLGLLKLRMKRDPQLRVVVTSATLDAKKFQGYFGSNVPLIKIPGRMFPVETRYMDVHENKNMVEAAVRCAWNQHVRSDFIGDILVFLTGQDETERAKKMFEKRQARHESKLSRSGGQKVKASVVLALYGKQLPDDQKLVFEQPPPGTRKIVFSTNVAETGVTIDGVRLVIDSGLCKEYSFDSKRNLAVLALKPISQSSATQRTGRAGRTAPGECIRLYSPEDFEKMRTGVIPEIQRSSLNLTILSLLRRGIDVTTFDFIDRPHKDDIAAATFELHMLNAVVRSEDTGRLSLTKFGIFASNFEMDVKLSRILFVGVQQKQYEWAVTLTALITMECNVFYRAGDAKTKAESDKKRIALCKELNCEDKDGDIVSAMKVFNKWDTLDKWWDSKSASADMKSDAKLVEEELDDDNASVLSVDSTAPVRDRLNEGAKPGFGEDSMLQSLLGNLANTTLGFFAKLGRSPENKDLQSDTSSQISSRAESVASSVCSDISAKSRNSRSSHSVSPGRRSKIDWKKKIQLQKKWAWKNSLNSKTLSMVSRERKSIINSLKQLGHWDRQPNAASIDATSIQTLFFSGFFLNTAQIRKTGEYITIRSKVCGYIGSGSGLRGLSEPKVCYLKIMKTTKTFLQITSPIADIQSSIKNVVPAGSRKELLKLLAESNMKCVVVGQYSVTLIRSLFGKRFMHKSQLEREIQADIELITTDSKENELRVWVPERGTSSNVVVERLKARIKGCMQVIKDEVSTQQVIGTTRVVLKAGAVVERLLLDKEFLGVNFLNLPANADSKYLHKLVTTKLKFNEDAVKSFCVEPTQDSKRSFGWVIFTEPKFAERCVRESDSIFLESKTFLRCKRRGVEGVSHTQVNDVDVVFSWATAPSSKTGFVKFATAEEANAALRADKSNTMVDSKSGAKILGLKEQQQAGRRAKKLYENGDKSGAAAASQLKKSIDVVYDAKSSRSSRGYLVRVRNLSQTDDEHSLINRFSRYGTVIAQKVHRKPVNGGCDGDEDLAMTLARIRSVAFSGNPAEVISHHIFPADEKSHRARMAVRYVSLTHARACLAKMRDLPGSFLHQQPIRVEIRLKHLARFHGDLYSRMKKSFNVIFETARQYGVVSKSTVQGVGKNCWMKVSLTAALGIRSASDDQKLLEAFRKTKIVLNKLLTHCVFEHKSAHLLFSQKGRKYMEWLAKQKQGTIHWYRKEVRLFGTEFHLEFLKQSLADWLADFEVSLTTTTLYIGKKQLRFARKSLKDLRSSRGVVNAKLNGRVLELLVGKDGIKSAKAVLKRNRVNFSTSNEGNSAMEEGDCPICLCPITNGHSLALCGHTFCLECLQNQFKSVDATTRFPISCHCGQAISWRDIESICDSKILGHVTFSAFRSYRNKKQKKYSDCLRLDCGQIFAANCKEVYCDQCNAEYCMVCTKNKGVASPTHPGYSCEQLDPKNEDEMFRKLFDSGKMAYCPNSDCKARLEKDGGCGHMTCQVCDAHFCWFCMNIYSHERTDCSCKKTEANAWSGGADPTCRYVYHHMSHCKRPVHKNG